jgi:hypothetical protein
MAVYFFAIRTSEIYDGERLISQTFRLVLGERETSTHRIADGLGNMTREGKSKLGLASAVT